MKTTFKFEEPRKLIYRKYSNFSQKDFQSDLLLNIADGKNNCLEFEKNLLKTLNKHAPKKTKIFRGNHKPHINKTLRKAIMKRSQLKNKANKTKDPKDILKYKKQRNYVVKLNNQSKQEHFDSLNPFLDSKPFWKSCKPYFSNKDSFGESKIIHLVSQNYSTGHFSQMSPVTKCKILLKGFPIILVLLKSSTNSS